MCIFKKKKSRAKESRPMAAYRRYVEMLSRDEELTIPLLLPPMMILEDEDEREKYALLLIGMKAMYEQRIEKSHRKSMVQW